jgi:hypothetical protein
VFDVANFAQVIDIDVAMSVRRDRCHEA